LHCTILIPAYNTERYIKTAISSALRQTYSDFDILIVDDGSTDRTREIAERCVPGNPISLLTLPHRGVTYATKIGLEHALGPVVTVLDSDDRLFPWSLEVAMPYFEERSDLGFLWTRFVCSNGKPGWSGDLPYGHTLWSALVKKKWWRASHQRFVRKEIYMQSRGLDPSIPYASDLQLAVVMASTGCATQHVPKVTYWYRVNRLGSISRNRKEQRECAALILRRAKGWERADHQRRV